MTYWQDRPVLVTGATGLVGGWLVDRLLELGAEVSCLVRDWVPGTVHSPDVVVIRGDVTDQALLERALGEGEIHTVFHLAAQTIVGVANANPVSTFVSNIGGTAAVLEACRRSPRVKKVVVASSDKAYGESPKLPYDESTPLRGQHPYDVSKSCADLLAQSYVTTYGMDVSITRCGNFFGGGDLNWSRIVPGTIRSALRGEPPVIRSDGQCLRDYLYVEDGVDAYVLLAERLDTPMSARGPAAYNFSYETPMTVWEIATLVLRAMGREDLAPIVKNEATNEIRDQYLSAERARQVLGWKPRVGFEEGLRRTVAWYKERLT